MASVATAISSQNGFADIITVVPKRSTDVRTSLCFMITLQVVVGVDMDARADMVVSELVDTGLIGEGCLSTYRHALKVLVSLCCIHSHPQHLLRSNPVMIPTGAAVFAQLVESDVLRQWHSLKGTPFHCLGPHFCR